MYDKKIEKLLQKERAFAYLDPEKNKIIVETAGFVPLEVKFKRFEQNGLMAQFNESEFTSSDFRDIYLTPDFEINPEDDYEEAAEKINAQQKYIYELRKKYEDKTSDISEGNSEVAPQEEKQKTYKKTEELNENSSQTEE